MFGHAAGTAITTGDNNTSLGFAAGDVITTGSNNVILGSGSDGVLIGETGEYKLSYNLNYALTTPNNTRVCMKTWATINFSGSAVATGSATTIPYTHAYNYLRGDGGTNWGGTGGGNGNPKYGTNSVTTIISASVGDTINVCTSFFGGNTSGELNVAIIGNQSWLTMEKI